MVLVATVATVAIISAASTASTAGAAGASGLAGVLDDSYQDGTKTNPSPAMPPEAQREIYHEQKDSLKPAIQHEIETINVTGDREKRSFSERLRYFGSSITHQAVDAVAEIAELPAAVLDSFDEVMRKYLPYPENSYVPNEKFQENVENNTKNLHQGVDRLYSTDLAENYTPEAKAAAAANDPFTYGVIQPPGEIFPFPVKRVGTPVSRTGDITVYRSLNETTKEVSYVGITKDFDRRAAAHFREKNISIEKMRKLDNLHRYDARAVEQTLIELHKLEKEGGTLINKINSIAKSNPKYADALKRGAQILKETGNLD